MTSLAGDALGALASQTTRDILAHVYDAPCTPSDFAEATGTSLQNIRYHLDRLLEADFLETVDTWYSQTGNEMRVFAPTAAALVLFAGVDDTPTDLVFFAGGMPLLVGFVAWWSVRTRVRRT